MTHGFDWRAAKGSLGWILRLSWRRVPGFGTSRFVRSISWGRPGGGGTNGAEDGADGEFVGGDRGSIGFRHLWEDLVDGVGLRGDVFVEGFEVGVGHAVGCDRNSIGPRPLALPYPEVMPNL